MCNHRLLGYLAGILFFPHAAATLPAADDPPPGVRGPSRTELQTQARRCRQILKTSIIDFYLPACIDRTNRTRRWLSTSQWLLTRI